MRVVSLCLVMSALSLPVFCEEAKHPAIESEREASASELTIFSQEKRTPAKEISLEVKNGTVAEVLRLLFDLAKERGVFPEAGTGSMRLTAMLKSVPFESALSLIADSAGLKVEQKEGTWVLTAVPKPPRNLIYSPTVPQRTVPILVQSFCCSHCAKSAAMVRNSEKRPDTCVQCSRALQQDWAFCPSCGAKRSSQAVTFAYCPFCGKDTKMPTKAQGKTQSPGGKR